MAKRSATELLEHYYMAMIYLLPIRDVDFLDKLCKHDLLPGDVKFQLESLTILSEKSSYFLDNVIRPRLAAGNSRCFSGLISVMKRSRYDNVKELAIKIEKELPTDAKYSSRPLLRDLHNIITPKVANEWYNLAIQLFDESQLPRLDEIRDTNPNDRREGCREMLRYWLDITPTATWDDLFCALRSPSLLLLTTADGIEKEVEKLLGTAKNQTESVKTGEYPKDKTQQSDNFKRSPSITVIDHLDDCIREFEDNDVVGAFVYLLAKLRTLFSEVDFTQLKNAFLQRGASPPKEFKQQVREAMQLDDLLEVLDDPMYCNWLNIRLLKRIVKAIDIPQAKKLIQAYESSVHSRKVSDVMKYFDSKCFKSSHVSKVDAKIVSSFESLKVADIVTYCETLESNMGVYAGSVTAIESQRSCLLITCVIPIHCTLLAYEMIKINFFKFRQFHIHYIEIESFPKVFALKCSAKENNGDSSAVQDTCQVISHYYTSLENFMDADSVSHMMLCQNLITDDDYEAITAAPNDNKMNTLLLQYVRSMNAKELSTFCYILKSIETHKIIGNCLSPSIFQKLSTNVRVSTSKRFMVSLIEQMKMSEVNIIFYDLMDYLYLQLSAMKKLPFKYFDINQLFTEQTLEKVKSFYHFKIYLLPFITWLDHSILNDWVVASSSEDAQQLLNLFDSKIESYTKQPIESFPIPPPSQLIIPLGDSQYTLLAMKFFLPSIGDTTHAKIILQDVMDIKLMMKHKWKISYDEIHSIQLVAAQTKFKLFYWIIPKCLVKMINGNLVYNWKSGIIMIAVLPSNFCDLEDTSNMLKGPFSSLNCFWQDDTEVLSNASLQSKLEKLDVQNLVQQYFQLCNINLSDDSNEMVPHMKILNLESEQKSEQATQFSDENSEMVPHMKILDMKNEQKSEQTTQLSDENIEMVSRMEIPDMENEQKSEQTTQLSDENIERVPRMEISDMENEQKSEQATQLSDENIEMLEILDMQNEQKSEQATQLPDGNISSPPRMLVPDVENEQKSEQATQFSDENSKMNLRLKQLDMENEQKSAKITQLSDENSELDSRVKTLVMENKELKNKIKKLTKDYGQKTTDDQVPTLLAKQSIIFDDVLATPVKNESSNQSTDSSWLVEIMSDNDEKEEDIKKFHKGLKASESPKAVKKHQEKYDAASSLLEKPEEKLMYLQFSKADKIKAQQLLFQSIEGSYFELLQKLLLLGVDIDIEDEDNATPLWLAIEKNCPLEMISLLMRPSLIGKQYKQSLAPIHRAAMMGDHQLVLKMINMIRIKDEPLPDIVQGSEEQQIEQLKSYRHESGYADYEIVNKKNKFGWTPLHYAADSGCVHVLQVLLMEQQCDVAITTKLGQTAFHFAARKGHLLCLKLLFAAAQCSQSLDSLPKCDKKDWNVACQASVQDNCEVMEWLLNNMSNYGADITSYNVEGFTALLIACEYQKTEMFKFLLNKSDDFTLTKDGRSALHIAACHDSVEIVELMLAKGFPVDQQDQNGETALHVAYKWGSSRVQQLLYQNGADDTMKNNDGKKPPDLAYMKFKIPKEILKREKKAIAKYVADLRKGKAKMPRCKLMILGEAGVGKTSLLNLLTGEPFNPIHNRNEGVNADFISASTISSNTWKKAINTDEEYKDVASKQLAQMLTDKEEPTIHQKKRVNLVTHGALNQQIESLVKKHTKEVISTASPELRSKQVHMDSHHMHHSSVHYNPSLRPPIPPPSFSAPPSVTPSPQQEVPHITPYIVKHPSVIPPLFLPRLELRREAAQQRSSYPISTDPDNLDIEIMRRAVKMKLQSCSTVIDHELPLNFSSFDFRGQKHYKSMHHCFLTSRAVYVVVFNVRHLLNDRQDQCIHELKFWVNSIHIYTDDDAKIVLVGTHRGPYPGHNGNDRLYLLTPEQEKTIYSIMIKNFDKYCYDLRVSWFEGNKIIAMVESSLKGDKSGVNIIRQKLLELGERYPGNNDDLPISYLRLEAKIFEERRKNNLILCKKVEEWAREYGIDDLTIALTFFHEIGTIIDPSKLPTIFVSKDRLLALRDTILLSPQWLADVMKELIKIDRSDPRYSPKSVHQLQQDGIVDEQFLSILWEKQLQESKDTFQFISILLQALGLIIPVGQQEPSQYYIPFMLPSNSSKMVKPAPNCNQIYISFDFFPPFLLHHLMFKLYNDSQQSKKSCFLATEGFIDSLLDSQWWVHQKNDDAIEVLIRTNPHVRTILPAMQYLNQSLVTILKELRAVKYILGPVAICVGCKEEKLLKYISYTDHQFDIANHLKCTSCAHCEAINVSTKAVISKAYKISEISFFRQIKKFSGDVLKQLERKLKAKHKMDDEATLDDVIEELYKKNEWDPWPQVVSVLERLSYEGCNGASDLVKQIKKEQLYMCDHVE